MRGRVILVALVALLALAGCREDEQNRSLHHQKGVYSGAPMPQLTDETRAALRARAQHQRY